MNEKITSLKERIVEKDRRFRDLESRMFLEFAEMRS